MARSQKPVSVLVVGGSLGGLFAGVALKQLGIDVCILERNPTSQLRNQGAGIVLGGDTQNFFQQYDRTQTSIAVTSSFRHYLDRQGREIDRENREQCMTSWDLLFNILRANFDQGAAFGYCEQLPSRQDDGNTVYKFGCTVTDVKENSEGKLLNVTFRENSGEEKILPAHVLIAADGASSTVRNIFEPSTKRSYAGYIALRGTCLESDVSQSVTEAFVEKITFFHAKGTQILSYVIPGENGTLENGERLINWVWYLNYKEGSELEQILQDIDGKQHRFTLPVGKLSGFWNSFGLMKPEVWSKHKSIAADVLPPQFTEVIHKTEQPFVQAITDVLSSRSTYLNGKVLLLGDALAGFRPHTAGSTSQAAFDALKLSELFKGNLSHDEWERQTMDLAREVHKRGIDLGDRSQFGHHPLAV